MAKLKSSRSKVKSSRSKVKKGGELQHGNSGSGSGDDPIPIGEKIAAKFPEILAVVVMGVVGLLLLLYCRKFGC